MHESLSHNVFVNRTLNMRKIKYIGFDMDHTLVRYNVKAFERLAYQTMLEKLIHDKHYPADILNLTFLEDFTIRGLIIDRAKGNLLKVSRHGAIRASFHGTRPIEFREQQATYRGTYIDLGDPNYMSIDTDFSISFATLYAQLIDVQDKYKNLPEYRVIAEDLLYVLDTAHRDGSLKSVVQKDLEKYIVKDPSIVEGLERYKLHGKHLFVLTNSDYAYTKMLLDYTIQPFLKKYRHWLDLFEYVITSAQKPRFFYDNLNFFRIFQEDGRMAPMTDGLVPGLYYGGSAQKLTRDLHLERDDVLYVGDHIYGDIVRVKKDCNWRTSMVIEGLSYEVEQNKKGKPLQDEIHRLMGEKQPLEDELVLLTTKQIEGQHKNHDEAIHQYQDRISEIDARIGQLIKKQQALYNPNWGEIMHAGNEESYFAQQVDRYACVYMGKISDLLSLSPRTYFRAKRRPLAHEL